MKTMKIGDLFLENGLALFEMKNICKKHDVCNKCNLDKFGICELLTEAELDMEVRIPDDNSASVPTEELHPGGKVYICSPYRSYPSINVSAAKRYCKYVVKCGYMPIAPHIYFTQFLDDDIPHERELGLKFALALLRECKELWVFGDEISDGMAAEIQTAARLGLPIHFFDEVLDGDEKVIIERGVKTEVES